MKIFTTPNQRIGIQSSVVGLGEISPMVNGQLCTNFLSVSRDNLHVQYVLAELGTFHIEILEHDERSCSLHYWLEEVADNFQLDSFGLCFTELKNLRAFLRNGYFSWDGSFYVQPESTNMAQGYAMTQLLPQFGAGSLVVGFDRPDRFQQTFILQPPFQLMVQTLWDRKKPVNQRCDSERLVIFEHDEIEGGLQEWATIVAQASPIPPRLSAPRITGWCSWYNLYAAITEENILDHLRGVADIKRRENLPLWVFQIDDGFTPEMGDWLEVKPQFPRGMKPLLDDIRAEGFTPGLWIAPFMVGNRSRLYRDHPEWVVKDRLTNRPLAHMSFYGEFRWHKRSEEYYILDTTHPDALQYLRQVFRTWRYEWECEYFKTDFMHFGSEYGPDRAIWHESGQTRIEIWRRVAEMIREEIGEAVWLGCGCPLWASVGLVDGVRIGRDVGVEWEGNLSAQSLLRDQAVRNFANHILWQADPDCILLREQFHHLTEVEVRSLALYAGMSGGLAMTSDALDHLSEERLRLWKLLLSPTKSPCRFPLLGQPDAVLVLVRENTVFLLNTSETTLQRTYPLTLLGLPVPLYAFDWMTSESTLLPIEELSVTLAPHDSRLIFLSVDRILVAPEYLV